MRAWKVGRYLTLLDRAYADGIRAVAALVEADPGEPVEVEMTEDEWNRSRPTAVGEEIR